MPQISTSLHFPVRSIGAIQTLYHRVQLQWRILHPHTELHGHHMHSYCSTLLQGQWTIQRTCTTGNQGHIYGVHSQAAVAEREQSQPRTHTERRGNKAKTKHDTHTVCIYSPADSMLLKQLFWSMRGHSTYLACGLSCLSASSTSMMAMPVATGSSTQLAAAWPPACLIRSSSMLLVS